MSVRVNRSGDCGCNQQAGYKIIECKDTKKKMKCSLSNPCTLISAINPHSELFIPELLTGGFGMQHVVGGSVDLTEWEGDLVVDAIDAFNNTTGIYTTPVTGDYDVNVTISYETSVPLSTDALLIAVPYAEVYDVANPSGHLLKAHFPAASTIITIPPVTSGEFPEEVENAFIINRGQVIMNGDLRLVAGQQIRVRVCTGGLTYTVPLSQQAIYPANPARIVFRNNEADTTITIRRYRNSPTIYVSCNN